MLDVQLLGGFQVQVGGHAVPSTAWRSARASGIIKALALAPGHQLHREQLMDMLWPELTPEAQTNNLNVSITRGRQALISAGAPAGTYLTRNRETVGLGPVELVRVDADLFMARAAVARRSFGMDELKRAVDMYGGELLPADLYEDLTSHKREELRALYLGLLSRLVEAYEARGEFDEAVDSLRRFTSHDPVNEEAVSRLMRIHARLGQRSQALREYNILRASLEQQFDTQPSLATIHLYRTIRDGDSGALPAVLSAPASSFVGRMSELDALRAACRQALQGQGRIVTLSGDPGIGKTRLAEEAARYAHQLGMLVGWGRCDEDDSAPAYWPWTQIIRHIIDETDDDTLCDDLRGAAGDIARIVPSLRERLPHLPLPKASDHVSERMLLFERVVSYLRRVSRRRPLLLVIDDLQWADTSSLRMLHYLSSELRTMQLAFVGTYRTTEVDAWHELTSTLHEMDRHQSGHRVHLHGLDEADIAHLIAEHHFGAPSEHLVTTIHRRTEGNPFFVKQLASLLSTDADNRREPLAVTAIPDTVRDAIRQRLRRVSGNCLHALELASVAGREFNLELLRRVSVLPDHALLDALSEALRAQIIVDAGPSSYRFSHALIQEVLYSGLTSIDRMQWHSAIGNAIERLHAATLNAHIAPLAYHFFNAVPIVNAERAVDYCVRAAEQATLQTAWETAIEQYERALQLFCVQDALDQTLRCDVLLAIGAAEIVIGTSFGNSERARAAYEQAVSIAREISSSERFARAVVGYAGPNPYMTWGAHEQIQLLREAVARLPRADSLLRSRALSRLSVDLYILLDTAEHRRQLSDESVYMAERLGDKTTLAFALLCRHVAQWSPDNAHARLADARAVLQHATLPQDLHTIFLATMLIVHDLLELGDIDEARAAFDAYVDSISDIRLPGLMATEFSVGMEVMWTLMAGDLIEADQSLQSQAELLGHPSGYFRSLFLLRREQDRLAELLDQIDEWIDWDTEKIPLILQYRVHRMLAYTDLGRTAQAREELSSISAGGYGRIPRDRYWTMNLAMIGEACVVLGEKKDVQDIYELLAPYHDRFIAWVPGYACYGVVSHYLGLLATVLDEWDAAERHFEDAIATLDRWNLILYSSRSRLAYADMLQRRDSLGDVASAYDLVAATLETAREKGLTRILREARERKAELERASASAGR